jgi:hypothetical protein
MRLTFLILPAFLILPGLLNAGEGEYAVNRIPAALLKGAHAVKRTEKIVFEVKNAGEAILYRKYAITILNENADMYAGFSEYYDKLHEIKNIEGTLYDANGKELKKLKNRQVLDLSGSDDNNLIDDNRVKAHHFFHKTYPYTVQYEVEIKYNGTLFFPSWIPREHEHFAVQYSSITITTPLSYSVRNRSFNYSGEPVVATGNRSKSTTWEARELPAIEDEFAAPGWYERNTAVFFGPTDFEIEKHKGSMTSWEEFGKFVYNLKEGKDRLPEKVRQLVHDITDHLSDDRQKVAKLYEYLQKNTRYISIQLGIGGWQPFDARYVAEKAYGDCKALTNYMYSLLKEAGIASFYTLVKAGRKANMVLPDFPSQQFNHVILFVPVRNDTIWLECTSQTLPAGYLSDFTADRYALAITEQGGKLVRTPRYGLKENLEVRRIQAVLKEDATLNIHANTQYGGLQQDYYHNMINSLSGEKIREWLQERLDFATYHIVKYGYTETRNTVPVVDESLQIEVSNYATITGKRLFIVPNIMTRSTSKLPADVERKNDLEMGFAYRDIDTVEIELPAGYTIESLPKEASIHTNFGKYTSSVKMEGNKLFYYRDMEHNGGRFAASEYAALVKFFDAIYKSDRSKVVLVRKGDTAGF